MTNLTAGGACVGDRGGSLYGIDFARGSFRLFKVRK